jgi:hypothetical protein
MKYILGLITVILPFFGTGQRLHADFYGGASNYQGDLQSKVFTFDKAQLAGGAGLSYDLTNKFILRGAASFAQVQGNDKYNKDGKGVESRNLNFKSNIVEGHIALEYNLLDLSQHGFTPYMFGGIALYHFNPYTFDGAGYKVFLKPLSTEGQGLAQYPDRQPYRLTQFAIPFGGGFKLALSENLQVGIEFGFRKLFNDYLDDVSTAYADSALLLAAKGPQSVALSYRGDELAGASAAYPLPGAERGNPKHKDWYYITGLRVSYLLGNGANGGGRKTKTGCPANIY